MGLNGTVLPNATHSQDMVGTNGQTHHEKGSFPLLHRITGNFVIQDLDQVSWNATEELDTGASALQAAVSYVQYNMLTMAASL